MRDGDRFWWVFLVAGLVFAAMGVLVPYLLLTALPWGDRYLTSADYAHDLGIVGCIAVICLGFGIGFAFVGVPMRRRHMRRLAALRGDAAAIPAAHIQLDAAQAPDVAVRPLELFWRTGKGTRFLRGPLLMLQLLLVLASVALTLFPLAGPIILPAVFAPSDPFNPPPQPMSQLELVLRIAGVCVILAVLLAGGIMLARVLPFLFGRPFGITATTTGLEQRTEIGNRVRMAWEEMRLLEVSNGRSTSHRGLVVYAPGKSIGWMEYTVGPGGQYAPVGATASEMTLRRVALLDLVASRTGLTPRTFVKALQREPESAQARETNRASGVIVLLVVAVIMAGLAAVEVFFPVTPYAWVNWASAGSLALLTVVVFIATVRAALPPRPLPPHAMPPPAGAPSLAAPGVVYSFLWRLTSFYRLRYGISGLCLAVNIAPAVYVLLVWLLQLAAVVLPEFRPQPDTPSIGIGIGQWMLAMFLGMIGLFGLAIAYTVAIRPNTQILADNDGLSTKRGRRERLIPWSSALDISWGQGAGGRTTYVVKSDVPTVEISWPSGIHALNEPPGDGALPIGADELAALVAAHIGKPIRVRT